MDEQETSPTETWELEVPGLHSVIAFGADGQYADLPRITLEQLRYILGRAGFHRA